MSIGTILVVSGILLMIVGVLVFVVSALRRRASGRATLRAVVSIAPSGETNVEWISDFQRDSQADTIRKMKLAVHYVAKIAYVLESGPPEVKAVLCQLLFSIVDYEKLGLQEQEEFHLQDEEEFIFKVRRIGDVLSASTSEVFYDKTDTFKIELIQGQSGEFVVNDLPIRGLPVNVPISALVLLSDIASSELTLDEKLMFQHVLKGLILSLRFEPIRTNKDLRLVATRITRAFDQTLLVQSMN